MRVTRRFLVVNGAALVAGLVVGLAAVGFRWVISLIESLAFEGRFEATARETNEFLTSPWGWAVLLVPLLGGLAVGLIRKAWPESRQRGVAEVMAAVQARGGHLRARSSWGHAIISAITVGTGGSTGREGPIAYIGASLGSSVARRFRLGLRDVKVLVGCGFAAGIAATFNAPVGGVLLALELIVPEFSTHAFIPLVLATVVAVTLSQLAFGDAATFDVGAFALGSPWELLLFLLLGLFCGVGAVGFIRAMAASQRWWERLPVVDWIKPALGGLAVGVLGLAMFRAFGQYHLFGTGYATISAILSDDPLVVTLGLLIVLAALKPIATAITIGSGGGGGVFSASLFAGAAYGGILGLLANALFPALNLSVASYALVGMAAFYAATARATLTAIVILAELVGDFGILLPTMLCAVTADAVSIALSKESIYTVRLSQSGILYDHDKMASPLDVLQVKDVMSAVVDTLPATMTVADASNTVLDHGHTGYPVVDGDGKLAGVVTRRDLNRHVQAGKGTETLAAVVPGLVITAYPDEMLHKARDRIFQQEIGRLIVVDKDDRRRILGILTRSDLLRAEAERDVEHQDFFER
ncbi:MAG: chloride channel protein [Candidatus Thermoplasmatota archaeon]